jgi:MFS family permease
MFPRNANAERPTLLRGTREAFRYVRATPHVWLALLTVTVVSSFSFNFNVLLPVMARQTLNGGPEVLGVLTAFFGLGAMTGALTSASLGRASGRVIGLYFFAFNGAGPLGGLLTGWLASRGGTETAFLVSGAASVAMTAFVIFKLRETMPELISRRWPVRAR